MDIIQAIRERRSVRAFLDKLVERKDIETILDTARWAPSGVNTQPWQCWVLGKNTIQQLGDATISKIEAGEEKSPDYQYYPPVWFEPYKTRRKACGLALYGALDIKKEDIEARKAQWYRNYYFFGAPVGIIVGVDAKMDKGSWMDTAMFAQNIMLAARGLGLETCPEASMAEYPNLVREICGISSDTHIMCGIALGWPDWQHPVNKYRTEREPLEQFVHWLD